MKIESYKFSSWYLFGNGFIGTTISVRANVIKKRRQAGRQVGGWLVGWLSSQFHWLNHETKELKGLNNLSYTEIPAVKCSKLGTYSVEFIQPQHVAEQSSDRCGII